MSETVLVTPLIGVGIALLFIRISALERRLNRLSRLEAKVDTLLRNAGITFDEFQDVPPGVREALARDERILAIKRFREAKGVDLKAAKEAIDEIRRRRIGSS